MEVGVQTGHTPVSLFYTPAVLELPRAQSIVSQARECGAAVRAVSEPVMAVMADTVTPSGILAVFPMLQTPTSRPLTWVVVLDGLRDPGNAGTILRSALAARAELLITTWGTVDVYSPKVVRAAMGAHFQLPLLADQRWPAVEETLRGLRLVLAHPREGSLYWQVNWRPPTALLIGGEATGPTAQARRLAIEHVTIPMDAGVESLNAAVAASILLFEGARQRFYSSS